MFELKNITIAYSDTPVIHNITLTIQSGEHVVFIGPSGAGKSTLLRKLYDMQRDRSAFIHQDYALVPQLSTFHNVYMGRLDHHNILYNMRNLIHPHKTELNHIMPILKDLGLSDKVRERVTNLSGGQQQRVAVARAIYRNADVILADEPVSAVDPHQSGTVINRLKQQSKTLILAMHDVDLAIKHFKRVIGLQNGRIAFDLPASNVTDTHLSALFKPC
jgi:phosphonate transport system ATP-binding protein